MSQKKQKIKEISSGMVIVKKAGNEWNYLFLRAYKNWDFPKGVVEPNEKPFNTAVREVKEETGITELQFPWGKIYRETEPYKGGKKIARYYLAETSQSEVRFSVNPKLGKPEHHEYRWVNYDELLKLAPSRLVPIIEWAHSFLTST